MNEITGGMDEADLRILAEVDEELREPAGGTFFRKPLEERFQQAREVQRRRHFVLTGLTAFASFDVCLMAVRLIMPDIFVLARNLSLGLITPLGLSVMFLIHRRKLPAEAVIFNMLMTLGSLVWWMLISQSPRGAYGFFLLPMFFFFSNIGYPLPFRMATGYTLVGAAIMSGGLLRCHSLDPVGRLMMGAISVAIGVYTLLACYRLERAERRNYLLTAREALRSEMLLKKNEELRDLSETDGLTKVANRRVFDRNLDQLWKEHLQSRTPLALLIMDIDHFKRLNDTYGHANGDVCLRNLARRLSHLMRPHQWLARYGGEEFVVLLEGEGAYRAVEVAERLRGEVEAMPIHLLDEGKALIRITISIGCATMIPSHGAVPADLFSQADSALYLAKKLGRNRVDGHVEVVAEEAGEGAGMSVPLAAMVGLSGN